MVLVGADQLFSHALSHAGAGCITALANLLSPDLRLVWEAFASNQPERAAEPQQRLNQARAVMAQYQPAPAVLKALVARRHSLPWWTVRPPLESISAELTEQILRELSLT